MEESFSDHKACISELVTCRGVAGKYGHIAQEAVAPHRDRGHLPKPRSSRSEGMEGRAAMDGFKLAEEGDVVCQQPPHLHKLVCPPTCQETVLRLETG